MPGSQDCTRFAVGRAAVFNGDQHRHGVATLGTSRVVDAEAVGRRGALADLHGERKGWIDEEVEVAGGALSVALGALDDELVLAAVFVGAIAAPVPGQLASAVETCVGLI
jgi:hypothetical protein